MSRAVVLSAVRTPVGRYGGVLAGERPDDLAAAVIKEAVARAGVDAGEIEDVYFGAANQAGEDNRNVARMAALLAGLPESVAGVTVNRLCASGLAAVVGASHAVVAGDGDLFVAGGVESMSRAPLVMGKPEHAFPRGNQTVYDTTSAGAFPNARMEEMFPLESMGETGENVAERYGVSREDQDAFALQSQQERWAAAAEAGRFDDELVPVGDAVRDEHPRPDTSAEKLATLKPAFRCGRLGHGRQLERDQRRRRRARDRERGERAGTLRRRAAGRGRALLRPAPGLRCAEEAFDSRHTASWTRHSRATGRLRELLMHGLGVEGGGARRVDALEHVYDGLLAETSVLAPERTFSVWSRGRVGVEVGYAIGRALVVPFG